METIQGIAGSIALACYGEHQELAEETALARLSGFPTYSDQEVRRLLAAVGRRFPGMRLWTLRPLRTYVEHTILTFRWDKVELLKRGILRAEHIPVHPKRMLNYHISPDDRYLLGSTSRLREGRLLCRIDVADDVGSEHPLAIFRPSSIRSGKWTGPSHQCRHLRLVVDNTRAPAPP